MVTTTAYLINRLQSSAVNMKSPMGVWLGEKADYSNLKGLPHWFICKHLGPVTHTFLFNCHIKIEFAR